MCSIHKDWPKGFISGLEFLRDLDSKSLEQPLYVIRFEELYNRVSSKVIVAWRARFGDLDANGITLDHLYNYYSQGGTGVRELDFFIRLIRHVSRDTLIAEKIYDTEILFFCLMCVQQRNSDARRFFHKLLRPAVAVYRLRDSSNIAGLRGGRHKKPHYIEASILAHHYRLRHPDARDTEIANYIFSCFSVNDEENPSKETIRRWLRGFSKYVK